MRKLWVLVAVVASACGVDADVDTEPTQCSSAWNFSPASADLVTCEPMCANNAPTPNDTSIPLDRRWSGASCDVVENDHGKTTCETTFDSEGAHGCCAMIDGDGDPYDQDVEPVLAFFSCVS
ncbi:MAG: hypothetical protein WKG01_07730 [Kofleriaceae bacterium]